jgi:phage recombination protein Bet
MNEKAIVKQMPAAIDSERAKIELIKSTVAKGVTDEELQLFLYVSRCTGLDPLARQIHAVKRWSAKDQREIMSIQTGIDGYRLIADRTGNLAGIDDPIYDKEGADHPNKASVTVHKMVDGTPREFTASARWDEYVQMIKQKDAPDKPGPMWAKMPYLMLGKCAESLALRKAFPAEMSGLHTFEEMEQADNERPDGRTTIDADKIKPEPQVQRKSQQQKEGSVPIETKPGCITEPQMKLLFVIQNKLQINEPAMKAIVKEVCQVEHRNEIKSGDFNKLLLQIDPEQQFHKQKE